MKTYDVLENEYVCLVNVSETDGALVVGLLYAKPGIRTLQQKLSNVQTVMLPSYLIGQVAPSVSYEITLKLCPTKDFHSN